jgi:hypothetical protein
VAPLNRSRDSTTPPPTPHPIDTGATTALDQIANWVKFADAKATILSAALGVVATLLATHVDDVATRIRDGHAAGITAAILAAIAAVSFVSTIIFLVVAIQPRAGTPYAGINRYAWPSVANTTQEALLKHVTTTDPTPEIWQQVSVLARLADRKFGACRRALLCFATLVISGVSAIAVSAAFQGHSQTQPTPRPAHHRTVPTTR